jgi:hypothetical protein
LQLAVSDKVKIQETGQLVLIELADRADWNLAIGSACWRLRIGKKRSALTSGIPAARLRAVAQPQCRELTSAFGSIVRGDEDEND